MVLKTLTDLAGFYNVLKLDVLLRVCCYFSTLWNLEMKSGFLDGTFTLGPFHQSWVFEVCYLYRVEFDLQSGVLCSVPILRLFICLFRCWDI